MNIIEEMKSRVSMKELLESYGVEPVRGNNIYRCISHSPDNHPSANINKNTDRFHCYACRFDQDIFGVTQLLEKCDFKKALKIIDSKFELGLMHELTRAEKLELTRLAKERERLKREKEEQKRFEKQVLNRICNELKFCYECTRLTQIKKGQYRDVWDREWGNIYFHYLEKINFLEWLHFRLCESIENFDEWVYDYIYGSNKNELLNKIKKGEIII